MGIVVTTVVLAALAVVVLGILLRTGSVAPAVAPRLSPGFAPATLLAGFPATAHNVAVLHDHLGTVFLDAVRGVLSTEALADLGVRCAIARGGVPAAVPSRLLAAAGPRRARRRRRPGRRRTAPPRPGRAARDRGHRSGSSGGSVFAPLPVVASGVPAPRCWTTHGRSAPEQRPSERRAGAAGPSEGADGSASSWRCSGTGSGRKPSSSGPSRSASSGVPRSASISVTARDAACAAGESWSTSSWTRA